MKEAYYFSHDANARHDPKIKAMRGVYGLEGYAWFWVLVEMMRESDGFKLDMHSKYAFHAFASEMGCETEKAHDFIKDCIHEFGLFSSDGTYFWSESLLKRMLKKQSVSEKARQSAEARWKKKTASDQGLSDSDPSGEMRDECERIENPCESDALKESKVKEIKDIPVSEIVSYLNQKTGSSFRATSKDTQSHIKARWKEGYRIDDFKRVIDSKAREWGKDEHMSQYLRPATLFGTKFESYLNAIKKPQQSSNGVLPLITLSQEERERLERIANAQRA